MSAKIIKDLMQSATRFHQAGQLDQAEKVYQQLLSVRAGHADAVHLLGVIACQRRQFQRGVDLVSMAISQSPKQGEFYNTLGNALRGLNRNAEAISAYRKACELDPQNLPAINNLAMALDDEDQTTEALACFDRLIAIKNDVAPWHVNRGGVQLNAGQLSAAIESQRRAISLQPNLAGAHAKLAAALLAAGQFSEGWREYEWRFASGIISDPTRGNPTPKWDGSPAPGKTLLIHTEQGYGDFLQFVRYAPLIAAMGMTVVLRCLPGVKKLVERVAGVTSVITTDEPIPPHDLQVSIFSLPLLFRTELETIPRIIPYLFADETKASKYAATNSRLRIGLVWAGSKDHGNDRRRSCPAEVFNALAGINGVDFYRLQMPPSVAAPSGLTLIDHTADFIDFDDTAALISKLDLVIAVDTSVAHLTGAMGKPVWILLPFAGEFRWLTNREDSPWYPTARLFRQSSIGDWNGVLQRVRLALQTTAIPA